MQHRMGGAVLHEWPAECHTCGVLQISITACKILTPQPRYKRCLFYSLIGMSASILRPLGLRVIW
jgi:hypothetical protein